MDFIAFGDWNPFIKKIEGSKTVSEKLRIEIALNEGKISTFTPTVLKNEANREFRWVGSMFVKGLFDGEHFFKFEQIDENTTRFVHGEHFSGIFSGVIMSMIGDDTQKGFVAMNEAIKERAEAQYANRLS